jgi:hypothetical protein
MSWKECQKWFQAISLASVVNCDWYYINLKDHGSLKKKNLHRDQSIAIDAILDQISWNVPEIIFSVNIDFTFISFLMPITELTFTKKNL